MVTRLMKAKEKEKVSKRSRRRSRLFRFAAPVVVVQEGNKFFGCVVPEPNCSWWNAAGVNTIREQPRAY